MTPFITSELPTHRVTNQAKPLGPYNAYSTDLALVQAMHAFSGAWASDKLTTYGAHVGGEMMALGDEANHYKPELVSFDRYGQRMDEVRFHPAYHQLMAFGVKHGVSNFAWKHDTTPGAHVARAAITFLHNQADAGTSCPLTMTHSVVPSLHLNAALAKAMLPKLLNPGYDPALAPLSTKQSMTMGMGMTEKQGGSDVRANTTRAHATGEQGEFGAVYALTGHKWFFSAPMCDAFLVLAQLPEGLSCFFVPRIWEHGGGAKKNAIHIQRLKDKLGNWSNASSEVEFHVALAYLVGPAGRGIPSILEMVALTRLDCMLGSASIMRQALVQAIHHAQSREAFGKPLVEHVLMQQVLADLCLESEAATFFSMRVAYAVDRSAQDAQQAAFARIATAVGKYWICKRCTPFVNEAQECLGGAGYVEDAPMARLLREAPLNSIWEGSGNIQCLDVLRAIAREPDSWEAVQLELASAKGRNAHFDAAVSRFLAAPTPIEAQARTFTEELAILLQAATLLCHGDATVAELFCETRLFAKQHHTYGANLATIADRALTRGVIERCFSPAA